MTGIIFLPLNVFPDNLPVTRTGEEKNPSDLLAGTVIILVLRDTCLMIHV
jgi:hypothetical protein